MKRNTTYACELEYTTYTCSRYTRFLAYLRGGADKSLAYKENNKLRYWKNVFTLHIPPWAPHTYDFVVLTSLTHPSEILLVMLQIGKAKDLSAPLRIPYKLLAILHAICFSKPLEVLNFKISSTSLVYTHFIFRPTLVVFRYCKIADKTAVLPFVSSILGIRPRLCALVSCVG
jgi:hypothetical protein